jgi:hypothetical protein
MTKTPHQFISEIGFLIYGRDDFKADMIRDLGISRNTLARYMATNILSPKAKQSLRGLCSVKAAEKERESKLLADIANYPQ